MGEVVSKQVPTEAEAKQMAILIIELEEEATLLHEVAVKLPSQAFEMLQAVNSGATLILVDRFAEVSMAQGWSFAYTDEIGAACKKMFDRVASPELKGKLAATALEVGVTHNRWYVMDIAARLIREAQSDEDALAVAHAIYPIKYYFSSVREKVNIAKLNPHLRELLDTTETSAERVQ